MVSIFLARFFAAYFLVMGFVILLRRDWLIKASESMMDNQGVILFAGIFTFMFGLVLVLFHYQFTADWRGVITVLAWLSLIKGIFLLLLPERLIAFRRVITSNPNIYYIFGVVMLGLAVFLGYHAIPF